MTTNCTCRVKEGESEADRTIKNTPDTASGIPMACKIPFTQFPWHFRNSAYPEASLCAKLNSVKKNTIDPILPIKGGKQGQEDRVFLFVGCKSLFLFDDDMILDAMPNQGMRVRKFNCAKRQR